MVHEMHGRMLSMHMYNLPSLVLKAKHLTGSAFCCLYRLEVSEQALDGIPLGFGIVVEDKPSELSCTFTCGYFVGP